MQNGNWFLLLVHAQRALHTPCSVHFPNGTLLDKCNEQNGILGSRIIRVLCPWLKSLFVAVVTEMISERGANICHHSGTASFADEGGKERRQRNAVWDGI